MENTHKFFVIGKKGEPVISPISSFGKPQPTSGFGLKQTTKCGGSSSTGLDLVGLL